MSSYEEVRLDPMDPTRNPTSIRSAAPKIPDAIAIGMVTFVFFLIDVEAPCGNDVADIADGEARLRGIERQVVVITTKSGLEVGNETKPLVATKNTN
jgi:hypothetical protein